MSQRDRSLQLDVPKGIRNGTLYSCTGPASLTRSVFDGQAFNSVRMLLLVPSKIRATFIGKRLKCTGSDHV